MPFNRQPGPQVTLSVDLGRMEKHFPPDMILNHGRAGILLIDRKRYDQVEKMLSKLGIPGSETVHEICYILLWMEEEVVHASDPGNPEGEFNLMWTEIERLQDFLLSHRVTSITLEGEMSRDAPGKPFVVKEGVNIDKVCDGIRSAFRDEFNHGRKKRRSKGRTDWQRRRMVKVRDMFLNYLNDTQLDSLSLEQQSSVFDRMSGMIGL